MPGYNCWGLPIDFLPKERSNEHLTFWIFLPSVIGAAIRRPQHAGHCKSNVFAGYSFMSADVPNSADRKNLNGWEASLEGKLLPFLGVVADGSGHYGGTQILACPVRVGGVCPPVNGSI